MDSRAGDRYRLLGRELAGKVSECELQGLRQKVKLAWPSAAERDPGTQGKARRDPRGVWNTAEKRQSSRAMGRDACWGQARKGPERPHWRKWLSRPSRAGQAAGNQEPCLPPRDQIKLSAPAWTKHRLSDTEHGAWNGEGSRDTCRKEGAMVGSGQSRLRITFPQRSLVSIVTS